MHQPDRDKLVLLSYGASSKESQRVCVAAATAPACPALSERHSRSTGQGASSAMHITLYRFVAQTFRGKICPQPSGSKGKPRKKLSSSGIGALLDYSQIEAVGYSETSVDKTLQPRGSNCCENDVRWLLSVQLACEFRGLRRDCTPQHKVRAAFL
jgi:hypothetical protein